MLSTVPTQGLPSAPVSEPAAPPAPHHSALDALRGLAALSVVVFHLTLLVHQSLSPHDAALQEVLRALRLTPAFLLFAGSEAVLVFFLLSGFVLYLMLAGRPMTYGTYVRRRLWRLYPPYLVAVLVSIGLADTLGGHALPGYGAWVNTLWQHPPDLQTFLQHVLVIGNPNSEPYDFVLWSLVQEMQVSLIFPLLYLLIVRCRARHVIVGGLLLSLGANAVTHLLLHRAPHAAFVLTPYLNTLHYLIFFALGALMARHRGLVGAWYAALGPARKGALIGVGLISFTYGQPLMAHLGVTSRVGDLLILPGALMLVLVFAHSPRLLRLSRWPVLQFLGRISYSLYLYHGVVLLAFLYGLGTHLPLGPLLLLAAAAVIPVSTLAYRAVERPSIEWSRGARRARTAAASRT